MSKTNHHSIVRKYCPECENNADPFKELLQEAWCALHAPKTGGSEDKTAMAKLQAVSLSNSGEGEGETGRAYANFLNASDTWWERNALDK